MKYIKVILLAFANIVAIKMALDSPLNVSQIPEPQTSIVKTMDSTMCSSYTVSDTLNQHMLSMETSTK